MKHLELVALGETIRHYRMAAGLSQEEMAAQCGLHRTYIGGIERGERNVGVRNLILIATVLQLHPSQLLMPINVPVTDSRQVDASTLLNEDVLEGLGVSAAVIKQAIAHVYQVLDAIDQTLLQNNQSRLSQLLELANLSAILGNLFRTGFVNASGGAYMANAPHSYPDLVASSAQNDGIEIKVALETNKPKGHLVKPGLHLIIRYVLGTETGKFMRGKENRGDVVWIWEVRVGMLEDHHFSVSNTAGDSGKTAVVTSEGMNAMHLVFCQLDKVPYALNGTIYRQYEESLNLQD